MTNLATALPGMNGEPPPEPVVEIGMPATLLKTKRHGGRMLVAGEGKCPAEIMFIATSVTEEEGADHLKVGYGKQIKQTPRYLKGPSGCILSDILMSIGINITEQYYTAIIKWLLPKPERNRPKRIALDQAMPILRDEIARVTPKIIVVFGKAAFDAVVGMRVKFDDVRATWFWSETYQARIFVMNHVDTPVWQPAMVEAFRMELLEVKKMLDETRGVEVIRQPLDYGVISKREELETFMAMLAGEKQHILGVDCEWGGTNYVDGRLRSMQLAWAPGRGRYIRLMDDKANYAFDVPYENVGRILQPHCNHPETKYIGYHISADFPWMHHWLGLDWYEKCLLDVEGAEQTLDENAELGLERAALKYTDLGRYDRDLVEWKAANKDKVSDDLGYLLVPDEILISYAIKDVDCPLRAAPEIMRRLRLDKTWDYYRNFRHHLVTDIFTAFALQGLPVRRLKIDILRKLYIYVRDLLEAKFVREVADEARTLLGKSLFLRDKNPAGHPVYQEILALSAKGELAAAEQCFRTFFGAKAEEELPVLQHFLDAPRFNMRSNDQKTRWLFEAKKLPPVKSTNQKEKGLPSIPWSRVINLPPEVRSQYHPAADKQTIKLLADDTGDALLLRMLDVLAVGNIAKSCFKPAEMDPDNGDLIKENGLHYWIASDSKIHGQMSVTETGRPRSWKPNVLNLASYVHKGVARGMVEVLQEQDAAGQLPSEFAQFLDPKAIPSVRSVVDVTDLPPAEGSEGWCMVESDYKTAEIRGMAFMSGDENLIRLMTEPDDQFALAMCNGKEITVRLHYANDSGISPHHFRPEFLLTFATNGKVIQKVSWSDMLRHDGKLVHPPHDLHWSLVEWVQEQPRELFDENLDRGGTGKPGNFSTAYGAAGLTLERQIKTITGRTPEPGTGDKILEALRRRQPVATAWLESLAEIPESEYPVYQAESGAKRRFVSHTGFVRGLDDRSRQGILSALGRQARNFPMQNSVSDSATRAGKKLIHHYRQERLAAQMLLCLYDSIGSLCPVELRFEVARLHKLHMTTENVWHNHGRTWNYPIDTKFVKAWSTKPEKGLPEEKAMALQLNDPQWRNDYPQLTEIS